MVGKTSQGTRDDLRKTVLLTVVAKGPQKLRWTKTQMPVACVESGLSGVVRFNQALYRVHPGYAS
jgi:hypothetical protein